MTSSMHAGLPAQPRRRRARIAGAGLLIANVLALAVPAGGIARAASVQISAQPSFFSATAGMPFNGTIASFVDGNPSDTASSFQVTGVDWGDKTEEPSTVISANGGFAVQASHTYHAAGRWPVTISLNDAGTSFTLNSTAIVSTCATSGAPFGPYAQAVLADRPLGYWRLDDAATSGCVVDSSGNGLNGTPNGGITGNQPGAFTSFGDNDAATAFDGATGYISLGDPAALQPSQVSVEAWVNTTNPGGIIVRKRFYGYGLALNGAGDPVFGIDDSNAISYNATGSASVADGNWHYLVGTYNSQQVCLYVDGVQANCATAAPIYYQPDLVAIGRDGGASDSYFNGRIDDVAIYGAALNQQQVQTHYAAATTSQTSTALTLSPTTIVPGQPFTLTATVQGPGAPTGTVDFCAQITSSQGICFAGVSPTSPGGSTFTFSVPAPTQGFAATSVNWNTIITNSPQTPSGPASTVNWTTTINAPRTQGSPPSTVLWTTNPANGSSPTTTGTYPTPSAINLPVGSYNWTASYSGGGAQMPSVSPPATLVVSQAQTTTSVTSSAGSVTAGQAVTFTARVKVTAPSSGTPTGTVIFIQDGTVVLGNGAVIGKGDAATLTTSTLTAGTHTITAIYGGDATFAGSISPGTSQAVAPA